MKTEKIYAAWLLFTIFLLLVTEASAQTYKKTFTFEYAKENFPIKKSNDGWDYIQPDSLLYNISLGSDTLKPELPSINYKILLLDNYRVKRIKISVKDVIYYGSYDITLRPNSSRTSILTANSDDKVVTYPLTEYPRTATCVSEEITNGYKVANLSINPFDYFAESKRLFLNTCLDIEITIVPIDEDEEPYPKKDSESIRRIVYNPEDIDAGPKNWETIENPSTQCTVGHIRVSKMYMMERKYTKDWNIRFAASEVLKETVQLGIIADSVPNKNGYITIERKKNGNVTDSLLYRQEGNRVYRYSETEKKDILLFDFGLNVGDDFITPNGEVWTVEKVKQTARYKEWAEKMITLKGKEDGAVKDVWLEHVGSLYTGILTYDDLGGSNSLPQLVYCRQGDTDPWLFDVNTEHFKIVYFHPLRGGDDKEYNFVQSLSPEELAYFNQGGGEYLYANFEGNTLHVYGKMGVGCYRYPMECRIIGNEILLEVNNMHYGDLNDCGYGFYVDIRIPQIKVGDYIVKYETIDYPKEMLVLTSSPSTIAHTPIMRRGANMSVNGSSLLCTSPTAVKLEIYTMDAVKVGEAAFISSKATVKVDKVPATYLYIVTYPNGRRESGKVVVK